MKELIQKVLKIVFTPKEDQSQVIKKEIKNSLNQEAQKRKMVKTRKSLSNQYKKAKSIEEELKNGW